MKRNRITSGILCLILLVSLALGGVTPALAAGDGGSGTAAAVEPTAEPAEQAPEPKRELFAPQEESQARILRDGGELYYATLQAAFDDAQDGDVIEMLADYNGNCIVYDKDGASVTLHLCGYTMYGDSNVYGSAMNIVNGTVKICADGEDRGGRIVSSTSFLSLYIQPTGTLVIGDKPMKRTADSEESGLIVLEGAIAANGTLTFNDGKITNVTSRWAASIYNSVEGTVPNVTVAGGYVSACSANDVCVYLKNGGPFVISDATFDGHIGAANSTLTLTNCDGVGIVEAGKFTINNCAIDGTVSGTAEGNSAFSFKRPAQRNAFLASYPDFHAIDGTDTGVANTNVGARILRDGGELYYATLQAAFDDAQDGDVIEMLADCETANFSKDASVTFRMCGHTMRRDGGVPLSISRGSFCIDWPEDGPGGKIVRVSTDSAIWVGESATVTIGTRPTERTDATQDDNILMIYGCISVGGTLVFNDGKVRDVAVGKWYKGSIFRGPYDSSSPDVTVNGGFLSRGQYTNCSVRMVAGTLTVNGGVLDGDIQAPTFTINNGVVNGSIKAAKAGGNASYEADGNATPVGLSKFAFKTPEQREAFLADYPDFHEVANTFATVSNFPIAEDFRLTLVPTDDPAAYSIMLTAGTEGKIVNRFTAADLTFRMTQGLGQISYTVTGNPDKCIEFSNSLDSANRYGFSVRDAANQTVFDVTGESIQLGTVTFVGFGQDAKFEIANALITTTTETNNVAEARLDGDGNLTVDTTVGTTKAAPTALASPLTSTPPKKELTVNVTFPNAVANQAAAYQAMQVTVSGGDLRKDIVVDLGSEPETDGVTAGVYPYAATAKAAAAWKPAASYDFDRPGSVTTLDDVACYQVVLTDILTENMVYSVTISGAGYRTVRYSVRMDDSKTLTVWNNVMDAAVAVEKSADGIKNSSAVQVTYLAGDIVQDAQINIYDLSAVVSYFGTTGLSAANHPNFAKYDLNRDGKINSTDIAYILISWGK